MDGKLAAVALTGIVLLSAVGVGGVGALADGAQASGNDTSTVTVSASGSVSAEPDRAVVYVAVTAQAPNASAATERLAANASTLRDAFGGGNYSVESVQTTGYTVYEQRDNGTTTYVAQQSFAVTTTNTSAAGALIDAAVANGATEIGGVSFTLSEERRQDLRSDAIDAAVDDARSQAEAVADSTGLTLGSVSSVSTGDGGDFVAQRVGADAETSIDASPVTVSATVEITYNATAN
ncbi:SIMPL domain-containing protein [Halosimplex aquaticum]|uniref:SIMPL domain-containing protein n=1 Tax=Halosimplex aquaticum TaxID=3026162 RepID=A0ABD5Y1B6_9EURY|nr:SIMPL domain-containing protein [Halosimplex aquaticum]